MEPAGPEPNRSVAARAHLDRGLRLEQAGNYERALDAYRDALAADPTAAEQVDARLRAARVYRAMADYARCLVEAREAVRLADEIDAHDLAAEAMNVEVGALQLQSQLDAADALATRALERARSPRVRGITLQNLGRSAAERRDFATSDRYFDQSIDAFRSANYDIGLAVALCNAARAALDRGSAERSIEIGQEAIAIARRLNALDVLLTSVENQAAALVALGNLESAESLLTEALGHFTSARNILRQAECLEIMGQMSELRPDHETAIRCYARALELATAANEPTLSDRLESRLSRARAASGGPKARHS